MNLYGYFGLALSKNFQSPPPIVPHAIKNVPQQEANRQEDSLKPKKANRNLMTVNGEETLGETEPDQNTPRWRLANETERVVSFWFSPSPSLTRNINFDDCK